MTDSRLNLLLLFGGVSSEHEVSCVSAASILEHADHEKYNFITVGITKNGKWYLTEPDGKAMASGQWETAAGNRPASISMDRGRYLLSLKDDGSYEKTPIDVAFPVLHGKNGEDGTMQGLLEIAGIPYVGSDTKSSAACMDKAAAKAMVEQAEVAAQAKACVIHPCDLNEASEAVGIFFKEEYPLFVKPANAGSSVGISKVKDAKQLPDALAKAFAEDDKVLVEEAIVGREIETAVLGNEDPQVSCVGEIFSAGEFYDYESKYQNAASRTEIVTDLCKEKEDEIRETALRIYNVLGCSGMARVDFFLVEGEHGYDDGKVIFNEVNTIPGFTQISMYPQLWEASGLPYNQLIDRLIELALEKAGK